MQFLKKIIFGILNWESRLILRKYKPFIIAVTGSVGKTSTKDAIFEVMRSSNFQRVRKSDKSFNSEIGLPLTVIGVPNAWRNPSGWLSNISDGLSLIVRRRSYPDCLVLEVGADHPGDIKRLTRWLKPHIAVITLVSRTPVHVEFFNSPEEVFEEKSALAEAVRPGGSVVLFADDDRVLSIYDRVKEKGVSLVSFGLNEISQVRALDFSTLYENSAPAGISFALAYSAGGVTGAEGAPQSIVTVRGILGRTYVYPLLAAAAVGVARGIELPAIAAALSRYYAPRGRMNVIPGVNGSTIIDDTYNSSPDAAAAALSSLKALECSGRRIALVADMMELGKYASDEHRRIGTIAAASVDLLFTVGPRSRMTGEEAVRAGMPAESVKSFDSAQAAGDYAVSIVAPGDIILVKGSQSMRMERASKALMREPERARELLVRQEDEWLQKA